MDSSILDAFEYFFYVISINLLQLDLIYLQENLLII